MYWLLWSLWCAILCLICSGLLCMALLRRGWREVMLLVCWSAFLAVHIARGIERAPRSTPTAPVYLQGLTITLQQPSPPFFTICEHIMQHTGGSVDGHAQDVVRSYLNRLAVQCF